MSSLYWETISPEMRSVLGGFSQSEIGAKFYLAGGTALALQLGHRRSLDLDFFSPTEDIPTLRYRLEKALASVEDIALMKLDALLARAARKDFYDLYFICQKVSLRTIHDLAPGNYPTVRDFEVQTVKRLVYFENAEQDIDPQLLSPVAWEQVKEFFIKQSRDIAASWLT